VGCYELSSKPSDLKNAGIFVLKRDEIKGSWGKLRNEELQKLH
jgi:hypothetical protein